MLALPAGAEKIQNEMIPYNRVVDIPCAAETVHISGPLHVLNIVTEDGKGGFHVVAHYQPAGVSGVGSVTGDTYRATGGTLWSETLTPGRTYTKVNNFRIIGQGPGNNFILQDIIHVTVNANGVVTTEFVNTTVDCK